MFIFWGCVWFSFVLVLCPELYPKCFHPLPPAFYFLISRWSLKKSLSCPGWAQTFHPLASISWSSGITPPCLGHSSMTRYWAYSHTKNVLSVGKVIKRCHEGIAKVIKLQKKRRELKNGGREESQEHMCFRGEKVHIKKNPH